MNASTGFDGIITLKYNVDDKVKQLCTGDTSNQRRYRNHSGSFGLCTFELKALQKSTKGDFIDEFSS